MTSITANEIKQFNCTYKYNFTNHYNYSKNDILTSKFGDYFLNINYNLSFDNNFH